VLNLHSFDSFYNRPLLENRGQNLRSIRSLIDQAIREKKVITIKYKDGPIVLAGHRTIEPHAFGEATSGNEVVRAWLVDGISKTGRSGKSPEPGWRLFRLDRIKSVELTEEEFKTRSGYNSSDSRIVEFVAKIRNSRRSAEQVYRKIRR
jgi:predicted DNA-binding transcriptional regulator YafY